ncbi:His Kinase A (phospho-acceptor) domain-containing protein [Cetobacterium ceti]|uniref:histidine kinase n=1 Tax=Cetobacterium ceti TaxID=180163 RepID=A0A1T4N687_9FUSO|nr:ATP-binding protein [Cetobacterium ceti]SJZ74358.1 His Kinase A (phospho-acceptor) domain-containing protein [Cetobacterium ceti]
MKKERIKKGKLKIFFSYGPRMGKTMTMINRGYIDLKNEVDVIIGYIDPIYKVEDFEKINLKNGKLDFEKILERNPEIIIIDELAKDKRHEEIKILLDTGIDVYTTLNITQVESLNDLIYSLTNKKIKDIVPDKIIKENSILELVDISPMELVKNKNIDFTENTLITLRELTLRYVADKIKEDSQRKNIDFEKQNILTHLNSSQKNKKLIILKEGMHDFLIIVTTLLIIGILGNTFYHMGFSEGNIVTIFILGILISSLKIKYMFSRIICSLLSVFLFNFFFSAPRYAFDIRRLEYFIIFMVMLISSFIINTLLSKLKREKEIAEKNAIKTNILLDLNKSFQSLSSENEIINFALKKINRVANKTVIIFLLEEEKIKRIDKINFKGEILKFLNADILQEHKEKIKSWLKYKDKCIENTNVFYDKNWNYIPLVGKEKILGIIGIDIDKKNIMDIEEKQLLEAILSQITFTLERNIYLEEKQKIDLEVESEKFKATLLRAISHDLRTPLTTISGSAYSLLKNNFKEETAKLLINNIYDDSVWLIDLVENLLALSKLENKNIKLKKNIELVEDIIDEAISHANKKIKDYKLKIDIKSDLIEGDIGLLIQVIINILNNGIKYSPKGSTLEIKVFSKNNFIYFQIKDNGIGVEDKDKENIFNLFFTENRKRGDERRGLGIGLSLCKTIVNIHGGQIIVRDNKPKGSIFEFTIPAIRE